MGRHIQFLSQKQLQQVIKFQLHRSSFECFKRNVHKSISLPLSSTDLFTRKNVAIATVFPYRIYRCHRSILGHHYYSRMPANGKNLETRSSWDMRFKWKWNRDKLLGSWYVRLNMPRATCPKPNVSYCDFLRRGYGYSAYYCPVEASNKLMDESRNLYAHVFRFFVSCCSCTLKIFIPNQWL